MTRLTLLQAQLLCCALAASDIAARAWRIQWLLRSIGQRVAFVNAVVINSFGDVASALTPLRLGGEPARLGAMLRVGVPLGTSLVAIGSEVVVEWPVVGAAAVGLAWFCGTSWWQVVAPALLRRVGDLWPWAALAAGASAVALWAGLLGLRRARGRTDPPAVEPHRQPLRLRWWTLLAVAPLTLVSVAARVALLPVLALTLPQPPPIEALALGSFALIYGQLLLPTPSGAGAVDIAFLGGAAGNLGSGRGALLVLWRLDTLGLSALLGGALALRIYGRAGLFRIVAWLRQRREATSPECSANVTAPSPAPDTVIVSMDDR